MSNLETEVRALIKSVERLSEHNMHDRMFRQWSDGVLPAIERVRGALDEGGEAVAWGVLCAGVLQDFAYNKESATAIIDAEYPGISDMTIGPLTRPSSPAEG